MRHEHCAVRTLCGTNALQDERFAARTLRGTNALQDERFAARSLCGTNALQHEHCAARTLCRHEHCAVRTLCNTSPSAMCAQARVVSSAPTLPLVVEAKQTEQEQAADADAAGERALRTGAAAVVELQWRQSQEAASAAAAARLHVFPNERRGAHHRSPWEVRPRGPERQCCYATGGRGRWRRDKHIMPWDRSQSLELCVSALITTAAVAYHHHHNQQQQELGEMMGTGVCELW